MQQSSSQRQFMLLTIWLHLLQVFKLHLKIPGSSWDVQHSNACSRLFSQDGSVAHLDHVFLRGSRIRFMIIPDMLKNAPMFKRIDPKHKVGCCSQHYTVPLSVQSSHTLRHIPVSTCSASCRHCKLCWVPGTLGKGPRPRSPKLHGQT